MQDNSAITPDNFQLNAEPIREIEDEAVKVAEESDKELAALNISKGWHKLSAEMSEDIQMFKTGGFIKKVDELSLEEVGKLFIIHQTVATMLQKYLTKVESAAEAVANANRAKLK